MACQGVAWVDYYVNRRDDRSIGGTIFNIDKCPPTHLTCSTCILSLSAYVQIYVGCRAELFCPSHPLSIMGRGAPHKRPSQNGNGHAAYFLCISALCTVRQGGIRDPSTFPLGRWEITSNIARLGGLRAGEPSSPSQHPRIQVTGSAARHSLQPFYH